MPKYRSEIKDGGPPDAIYAEATRARGIMGNLRHPATSFLLQATGNRPIELNISIHQGHIKNSTRHELALRIYQY